jgi:prepilin-type N-terminal cleavage/methylation domain-containing protein
VIGNLQNANEKWKMENENQENRKMTVLKNHSKIQNPKSKIQAGFTLLEMMIAMFVILFYSRLLCPLIKAAFSRRGKTSCGRISGKCAVRLTSMRPIKENFQNR